MTINVPYYKNLKMHVNFVKNKTIITTLKTEFL